MACLLRFTLLPQNEAAICGKCWLSDDALSQSEIPTPAQRLGRRFGSFIQDCQLFIGPCYILW